MLKLLILPNYSQNDNLFILINKEEKWIIDNYNLITSLNLPNSWSRGLPNFLLPYYDNDKSFVLGQVYKYQDRYLFFKSCAAGKDKDGRTVFLTAMIEQNKLMNETINIANLENLIKLNKNYIISNDKINELKKAIELLNNPSPQSEENIQQMFIKVRNNFNYKHFTSVSFKKAAFPPDSEVIFDKTNNNSALTKSIISSILIIILILLIAKYYYHTH